MNVDPFALLSASLGFMLIAVFSFVYVIAAAPTPKASRLGIRGLKRALALQTSSFWFQLEPLARWLAGRLSPLIGQRLRQTLDRNIVLAGDFWGVMPEEYAALCVLGAASGGAVGGVVCTILQKPMVWVGLAALLGGLLPWLHFSGEAQRRALRIQNSLPYAVDLISLSLSAGLDFPGALRQVLDKASDPNDPMMEEIGYILQELSIGKTRRQALMEFNARCPYTAVTEFVGSVIQAEERGNPLADILKIQATSSRARRSVRAEETAAKAGVQILVPCVLVFIAVLLLIVGPLFMALGPALGGL
jgi:tight adherence protein C